MSKFCLSIVFIGAFLISMILGVWISTWTVSPVMAIDSDSFELQLRFLNGTPIEHFNWGTFSKGQTKQLEGQLMYSGTLEAKVLWNTTDFPSGWSIEVWDVSKEKVKEWPAKNTIKLTAGEMLPVRIVLKEVDGVPGQLEAFALNFLSFDKIKA